MIIDTDVHAVEPPELWTDRMSKAKWGDSIPTMKWVEADASERWVIGEIAVHGCASSCVCPDDRGGVKRADDFPATAKRFEDRDPSGYDPHKRAAIMDQFGIDAAVLYPNVGLTGEELFRKINLPMEFATDVTKAYNDWVLTWSESVPGRFVALANLPYWDVAATVEEIQRCASAGHRGFIMSGKPELHQQPFLAHPHWNPIWAAAQETGLSVAFHAAGGGLDHLRWPERTEIEGRVPSLIRFSVQSFLENGVALCDLLMSGILSRFPDLKFVIVESGAGWVPFLLTALDVHASHYAPQAFEHLPSDLFHRQVYVTTWFEDITQEFVELVGPKNLLFETDYPHPTCLIGDEVSEAVHRFDQLEESSRERVLWQNAAELYGLKPSEINPAGVEARSVQKSPG